MGIRDPGEPEYPRTREAMSAACDRLVGTLRTELGERLMGVLLCGSWARGEARPPESDIDVAVIVDTVDRAVIAALRRCWEASDFGPANVYGADEVPLLARDGLEQFTTNAIVLWGANPFTPATREDFAQDLARVAESIARNARCVLIYPWLTRELKVKDLRGTLGKTELRWALRCLAAYRTGEFPQNQADMRQKLTGSPEEPLIDWCDHLTDEELGGRAEEIALELNEFTRAWFEEIAPSLPMMKR